MPAMPAVGPAVGTGRPHVTVIDPVVDGVPDAWDSAVRAWRLPAWWLAVPLTEAAWTSNVPVWLALAADRGATPYALVVMRHLGATGHRRYAAGRRPPVAGIVEIKMVPMGAEGGLAVAPGLDAGGVAAVLSGIEKALRRRLGPRLAAVAYRHVGPELVEARRLLGRTRTLSSSADMTLVNPGTGRDGYLATLPAKWRSQLRKIHSEVSSGVSGSDPVTVSLEDKVDGAEASTVIDIVRRRHHPWFLVRPPISASYLDVLGELPGTRFVTYRNGHGRLLALSTVHDQRDGLALTWWGSTGESRHLYFDQYLRLVNLMIDENRPFLRLGKGMNDIKARYGAQPSPQWTVLGAL